MRGRLLAWSCAVGLIAAPAFAATESPAPADMSPGAGTTMHHHPAHHMTHYGHSWGRQTDTSQNGAIDRLNQESLDAARQNRPFDPGSGGSMGGGSGMGGSHDMGTPGTGGGPGGKS